MGLFLSHVVYNVEWGRGDVERVERWFDTKRDGLLAALEDVS